MEEKWIDKLKNFEAQPPAGLWDRLGSALDGADKAPFARKLQDFEATPPPAAWNRIERRLDAAEPEAVPVVALKSRRSFAPYIAAAALIGILLVGAALLFNRPSTGTGDNMLARTDTPVRRVAPSAPADTPVTGERASTDETNAETPDVAITPARAATSEKGAERVKKATRATNTTTSRSTETIAQATVSHPRHVDDERYLVRAYNDGSVVRFSKKVSPVVDCAENSSGFTQSLCRVSIGAVQDKVAAALTTDFGSLIERLQNLEKASR